MAKADRVHSTPRRTASKIKPKKSAVSLVEMSGLDLVPTRKSRGKPAIDDPVYALIETHKAMSAALDATLHEKSRIEGAGRPFDDSLAGAAHDAEEAALIELIETVPPTLGGIIASMVYITESAELDHYRFSEDDLVPLLANLCEALQSLEVLSCKL